MRNEVPKFESEIIGALSLGFLPTEARGPDGKWVSVNPWTSQEKINKLARGNTIELLKQAVKRDKVKYNVTNVYSPQSKETRVKLRNLIALRARFRKAKSTPYKAFDIDMLDKVMTRLVIAFRKPKTISKVIRRIK